MDPFNLERDAKIRGIIAGIIYWGISMGCILLGMNMRNGLIGLVGFLLLFAAIFVIAVKGWNWLSGCGFGTYGHFIKFLAILFLMTTVLGAIPVIYWTGKGIMQYLGVD